LGFNFWQVVVLLLVFMFQLEIRQILERIKTLEIFGNKIGLTEDTEALLKALRKINDEATKPGASIQVVRDELSSVLRRRCLGALINIRGTTTALWPHLKNLLPAQTAVVAEIRLETYKEIEPSLRLLSAAGMFDYSALPIGGGGSGIQKISLLNIHPSFQELVHEAERF
jgi:hypothetical protein